MKKQFSYMLRQVDYSQLLVFVYLAIPFTQMITLCIQIKCKWREMCIKLIIKASS